MRLHDLSTESGQVQFLSKCIVDGLLNEVLERLDREPNEAARKELRLSDARPKTLGIQSLGNSKISRDLLTT